MPANHRTDSVNSNSKRTGPLTAPGVTFDPLIDIRVVLAMIGQKSPTSVYERLAERDFPEPIKLGTRCTRWRKSAIEAWITSKERGSADSSTTPGAAPTPASIALDLPAAPRRRRRRDQQDHAHAGRAGNSDAAGAKEGKPE